MPTINYIARKDFKYNGKIIKSGSRWEPGNFKFDAQVKEHLVSIVERVSNPRAKKQAVKRGTSGK